MKPVFRDITARWVPFGTAAVIVVVTWGSLVWNDLDFALANQIAAAYPDCFGCLAIYQYVAMATIKITALQDSN